APAAQCDWSVCCQSATNPANAFRTSLWSIRCLQRRALLARLDQKRWRLPRLDNNWTANVPKTLHKGVGMNIHDGPESGTWPGAALALATTLLLATAVPALAQEPGDDENAEAPQDVQDQVVVTGSRLQRDTYTSIAPLQVITSQVSREVGLIDAGEILQESTAASGQQIDLTFQG